jgi:hypothetical protein
MRRRDQWIEWIRAVEREGETAAYAVKLLEEQLQRDPGALTFRGLGRQDYAGLARNREATYVLRLFAEFENGMREAWVMALGEATQPRTTDLLEALAARRRMPNDRLTDAHRVRRYRNSIVHDESEPAAPVSLAEARRFLCRFFSFMPEHW